MTKLLNLQTGEFIQFVTSRNYDIKHHGHIMSGIRTLEIEESYKFETYDSTIEQVIQDVVKELSLLQEEVEIVYD